VFVSANANDDGGVAFLLALGSDGRVASVLAVLKKASGGLPPTVPPARAGFGLAFSPLVDLDGDGRALELVCGAPWISHGTSGAAYTLFLACDHGFVWHAGSGCTACPAGHIAVNASVCAPCPENTWAAWGADECSSCPTGTWAPHQGATGCTPCAAYAWSVHGSACTLPSPGFLAGAVAGLAFVVIVWRTGVGKVPKVDMLLGLTGWGAFVAHVYLLSAPYALQNDAARTSVWVFFFLPALVSAVWGAVQLARAQESLRTALNLPLTVFLRLHSWDHWMVNSMAAGADLRSARRTLTIADVGLGLFPSTIAACAAATPSHDHLSAPAIAFAALATLHMALAVGRVLLDAQPAREFVPIK
jgi:hypothetical protein